MANDWKPPQEPISQPQQADQSTNTKLVIAIVTATLCIFLGTASVTYFMIMSGDEDLESSHVVAERHFDAELTHNLDAVVDNEKHSEILDIQVSDARYFAGYEDPEGYPVQLAESRAQARIQLHNRSSDREITALSLHFRIQDDEGNLLNSAIHDYFTDSVPPMRPGDEVTVPILQRTTSEAKSLHVVVDTLETAPAPDDGYDADIDTEVLWDASRPTGVELDAELRVTEDRKVAVILKNTGTEPVAHVTFDLMCWSADDELPGWQLANSRASFVSESGPSWDRAQPQSPGESRVLAASDAAWSADTEVERCRTTVVDAR